ncbi:hydrolase [Catenovulum agarivorans DS-2]|uniref:Hydrolase n=1 Tax=Catenovulum agarivorans DS-2 TaxID=1328313 RepID=W7QAV5_9ALTE|nr:alpha/beta fold hydrolase [Catenovulum agarivorans]EWH09969.1 hydrolase [Catenovulum agarivorans DS-2]
MQLNYSQVGSGANVVLLHGLFGNADNLAQLAKALSAQYLVTSIDLRNHGNSPHSSAHSYQDMATDIQQTLEALNIDSCHLFGHSMGGKAAMYFALHHPTMVNSLIVEDIAPVTYPNRHQEVFNALTQIELASLTSRAQAVKQLSQSIDSVGICQFLAKSLYKSNDTWQWKMNLPVLEKAYPEIAGFPSDIPNTYQGPTLFIKGMDSDYISTEHKTEIQQRFPTAHVKVIQGAGHWIHAEKPNIFNKIVADFLQKPQR